MCVHRRTLLNPWTLLHGLTAQTTGNNFITERKSPHNQNTVPVLDQFGHPLAPARPSRVRQWLESGRATKVWVKGIFAVQLHDQDADRAAIGNFALNIDPGETTGIAITRESTDGKYRTIVGAYEHQHRNNDIHYKLDDRRQHRGNRRSRLRRRPQRSDNRANARTKGRLPPSIQSIPDDVEDLTQTLLRLYPIKQLRAEYLRFDTQLMQNPNIRALNTSTVPCMAGKSSITSSHATTGSVSTATNQASRTGPSP